MVKKADGSQLKVRDKMVRKAPDECPFMVNRPKQGFAIPEQVKIFCTKNASKNNPGNSKKLPRWQSKQLLEKVRWW